MKSGKFKKITDDMIGTDDKLCSCASEVVDILISRAENEKGEISLRKNMDLLKKRKRNQVLPLPKR